MTETKISEFNIRYYIPAIKKLSLYLPHVRILGTNKCSEMQHTAFKIRELFKYVLCRRGYAERVVAIFANKIQ